MKRSIALLLAALLLATLFTGCAGIGLKPIVAPTGNSDTPAKTETNQPETNKTEPAISKPETEAPETEPVKTEAPETEPPATEAPKTEAPTEKPAEPVVYDTPCGTYKLKSVNGKTLREYFEEMFAEVLSDEIDLETLLALSGMSLDSLSEMMTFVLHEDGTLESHFQSGNDEEEQSIEGTWELKGDKIIMVVEGETQEIGYIDGELVIDDGEQIMVFAR